MGCTPSTEKSPSVVNNAVTLNGNSNGVSTTTEDSKKINENMQPDSNSKGEEEKAATRIQAQFRGYKTRNELKATMSKPAEEEVVDIDLNDPDVKNAATKIQASFRGHKAKKVADKEKKEEAELSKELEKMSTNNKVPEEEELDIDLTDPELNKAAVKIQAQFKGHISRKIKPSDKADGGEN